MKKLKKWIESFQTIPKEWEIAFSRWKKDIDLFEKSFDKWSENFQKSENGKDALLFLEDELFDRSGRDIPEYLEQDFDWLKINVLKTCYYAATYKDRDKKLRTMERDALYSSKAVKRLRQYMKQFPAVSSKAINRSIHELRDKHHIEINYNDSNRGPRDTYDLILKTLDKNLQRHKTPNDFMHWRQSGGLLFKKSIVKDQKNIDLNSLIFHVKLLIGIYISNGPGPLVTGSPLPDLRLNKGNKIIAKLVFASLGKKVDTNYVKERLKYMKSHDVGYMPWE